MSEQVQHFRPDAADNSIYGLRVGSRLRPGGVQRLAVVYMVMLLVSFTAIGGLALASLV